MKRIKTYEIANFKALEGEGPGKFQAVVSVFGNVDLQGDRVMPGAFKASLAKWRRKGDPIPVIWSHDWLNPDAHIGYVDPEDAAELVGDQKDDKGVMGGLLVKGTIDVHKPFAAQVFDLLKSRRVKEWSFSYEINKEKAGDDGANELLDLDIHEIGPCLKGANPETYTVSAKSALEKELKEAYDVDRSYIRLIEMLKTVEDPDVANMLTKTWTQGTSPALKTMKVSQLSEQELKDLAAGKKTDPAVVKVEYEGHEFNVNPDALELADGEKDGGSKPWHVEKRGDQWCVVKDTDGSTVACHDSEADANAQVRALYASESSTEAEGEKGADTEVPLMDDIVAHMEAGHGRLPAELDGIDEVHWNRVHSMVHARGAADHEHGDENKSVGDLFWAGSGDGAMEQHKITGVFTDGTMTSETTGLKWDGAAAMRSAHSAADFRKIAFERDNDSDPDTAAHWALPHHPSPGAEADPQGVSAALAALHGARGGKPSLKNPAAAESHLKAHGGGSEDDGKSITASNGSGQAATTYVPIVTGSTTSSYMAQPVDEIKTRLAKLEHDLDELIKRIDGKKTEPATDDPDADLMARLNALIEGDN